MNNRKAYRPPQKRLMALSFSLGLLLSCDMPPGVDIQGGTVPVFKLRGRGGIEVITVSGPDFENPNNGARGSRYSKPYWQIVPEGSYDIAQLAQSEGLVYGQVPKGFKQVFPQNGAAPLPVVEGEYFGFSLRVADGGAIGVRFSLHNGKIGVERS